MNGQGGLDMEAGKVVVVAVKASKEIPKTALVWALTHVVQPRDSVKLIVVLPPHSSSKRAWSFSLFASDCASSHRKSILGTRLDQRADITESCSELLSQLHDIYDPEKIKIRVKVVSGTPNGVVALEARKAQSNWVILDKNLKHEQRYCMEELQCNLVVIKKSQPKVLRLNLNVSSPQSEPELSFSLDIEASCKEFDSMCERFDQLKAPSVTPVSSPEHDLSLTTTDIGTSSVSSSDPGTSPFFIPEICWKDKKEHYFITVENQCMSESESDMDIEKLCTRSTRSHSSRWRYHNSLGSSGELRKRFLSRSVSMTYKSMLENLSNLDQEPDVEVLNYRFDLNLKRSVREAISLSSNTPAGPPPLCSVCQHKGPVFGGPPKWFTFAELEHATDGFSEENFLAEGGFGAVYRGVLPDGQVVAVKQYKLASSQGDQEFCSEVEVLSCAQHRNVVMLIGFCIEGGRRLLVYEFVCNGSLDSHLFGSDREPLSWFARQKIATGAARGLRYLHEECRVGCIVHRDMRPSNILLTHDFEPLVGDFGLARWQPKGNLAVETRIIGTFGYLAPEYVQSGEITDKADVYSFGVVLIELITGKKAIDITRAKGQQCLSEWARPLLEKRAVDELIDERLKNTYPEEEVYRMMQCASMCIQRDPLSRPSMSRVVRALEGDVMMTTKKQDFNL